MLITFDLRNPKIVMSSAIVIEGLSKTYVIDHKANKRPESLRASLAAMVRGFVKSEPKGRDTRETLWALRDVSFAINEGEVFGIIGKNGAGKSTLLKILARITEPTSGAVSIRGRVGALLEVGTGFHAELTGRENIYLNGTLLGLRKRQIDKLFDSIVAFAETEKFLDTPVKRYSSGMYVRLAFAVAAHLEPDVLIVDEVLAVGDVNFQKKCISRMNSVAREGRTVIVVTHSMSVAESLTTRCAWLHNGEVRQLGKSSDVVASYNEDSEAQQLGISEGLHDYRLRRGSGEVRLKDVRVLDYAGNRERVFPRGETIRFAMELSVLRECRDVCLMIGFKVGIGGEMLVRTPLMRVSSDPLSVGTNLRMNLDIDSSALPAFKYDLYIWVGPGVEKNVSEFYDIADGLVPPIQIVEKTATGESSCTEVKAKFIRLD